MCIVNFLCFCTMMLSSSTAVLGNRVGKVNEGMYVCLGGPWSINGVSESDMKGSGDYCYD